MLKEMKIAVLRQSRRMGLTARVARSAWRRRRLLVLCYHGISLDDEHQWDPDLYMSPERFRERLDLLRAGGYEVLALADAVPLLLEGRLPAKAVSITFDDGMHDFYARAYPILREFRYPATLYLTTYYCHDQRPVFDLVCSYILWKGLRRELDGAEFLGEPGILRLGSRAECSAVFGRIYRRVREAGLSADAKDELARRLAARLEVDYERIRSLRIVHLMTPQEVRAVAAGGVDVQMHTHRHRTPRDRTEFVREIRENRTAIAAMTGSGAGVEHFCYPSGDYDLRFLPWLREEGVKTATTCHAGFAGSLSEPLLLPRVLDCSGLSSVEFEGWLSGVSSFLPRRRR